MNKKLTTIITLTLSLIMIITGISPVTTAFAEDNYKHEDIHDFIQEGQSIISQETITDFAGNTFKLYELSPSGYAIYSFNENASIFIEGSYATNSPYYGESGTKYYCGIGEYFIEPVTRSANANVRHLRTDESISKTNLTGAAFSIDAEHYIKESSVQTRASFPSSPDPNKTVQGGYGFTLIKEYLSLALLTEFPNNTNGTCGIVAICILLGFYDKLIDDDIITQSSFVVVDSNGKTIGTTQIFHDYLLLVYPHLLTGITFGNGYPMGAYEISDTISDYIINDCTTAVGSRIYQKVGPGYNSAPEIKKIINGGNPVILTMLTYTYTDGGAEKTNNFHDVVVYGYDSNNRYYAHMGWKDTYDENNPNSYDPYKFASIIISNVNVYNYFALNHSWA